MRFLWFVWWVIFKHVLKVRGWEGIGFHHPLTLYTPKDVGISPGSCERCSNLSYQHLEKNRGAVLDTLNKGWVNWHPLNRNHVRHHDLKVLGSIYIYIKHLQQDILVFMSPGQHVGKDCERTVSWVLRVRSGEMSHQGDGHRVFFTYVGLESRWWFRIFFNVHPPTWGNDQFDSYFFKMVETIS